MKFKKTIVVLAFIFGINSNAFSKTTYFGNPDCGQWIKSPSMTHKTWLLGFLSGMNASIIKKTKSGKPANPLGQLNSAEQAFNWMDNYCTKNPLDSVSTGAIDLYIELSDREI